MAGKWLVYIGKHIHSFDQEREADARLVAAAPELLQALQPFITKNSSDEYISLGVRTEDVARARAAVAKATGSAA